MGRSGGGYGRGGASGRSRSSGRGRGIHTSIGQHTTSSKKKEKLGISKDLGKSMFASWEKSSAGEMQTTWEKVVQHIVIILGQDIST